MRSFSMEAVVTTSTQSALAAGFPGLVIAMVCVAVVMLVIYLGGLLRIKTIDNPNRTISVLGSLAGFFAIPIVLLIIFMVGSALIG